MRKKQKVIAIIMAVVLLFGIIGIGIYVNKPPKESEWDVRIWVENVSKSGLTLHMERNATESDEPELDTGDPFCVERWSLFGWKVVHMKEGIGFNAGAYPIDETFEKTWEIDFEFYYGRLPMGLYRISKSASVVQDYNINEVYYAPFVVVAWQELLHIIIGTVFVIIFILLEKKYKLLPKMWNTMRENKKRTRIVGSILAAVILSGFILISAFQSEISAAYWQYKIDITAISEQQMEGTLTYYKEASKEMDFLHFKNSHMLQVKTWYGWRDVKEIRCTGTYSVRAGSTVDISFNWGRVKGNLEKGTYRIVQPFDTYLNRELKDTGTIWITFQVE